MNERRDFLKELIGVTAAFGAPFFFYLLRQRGKALGYF